MSHFVTTDWLQSQLGAPDLIVLDASWYLPAQKRDAVKDYAEGHIPGAQRFDLDAVSDHSSSLPHMLPSPPMNPPPTASSTWWKTATGSRAPS